MVLINVIGEDLNIGKTSISKRVFQKPNRRKVRVSFYFGWYIGLHLKNQCFYGIIYWIILSSDFLKWNQGLHREQTKLPQLEAKVPLPQLISNPLVIPNNQPSLKFIRECQDPNLTKIFLSESQQSNGINQVLHYDMKIFNIRFLKIKSWKTPKLIIMITINSSSLQLYLIEPQILEKVIKLMFRGCFQIKSTMLQLMPHIMKSTIWNWGEINQALWKTGKLLANFIRRKCGSLIDQPCIAQNRWKQTQVQINTKHQELQDQVLRKIKCMKDWWCFQN